jgi:hypothetical protein
VTDFSRSTWARTHWPTFNVADSGITVGVLILAWDIWKPPRKGRRQHHGDPRAALMHPEIFRIGSFGLPSYGLMMAVAFPGRLWLLRRRAPSFGIPADTSVDVAVWILISSLVGSEGPPS